MKFSSVLTVLTLLASTGVAWATPISSGGRRADSLQARDTLYDLIAREVLDDFVAKFNSRAFLAEQDDLSLERRNGLALNVAKTISQGLTMGTAARQGHYNGPSSASLAWQQQQQRNAGNAQRLPPIGQNILRPGDLKWPKTKLGI